MEAQQIAAQRMANQLLPGSQSTPVEVVTRLGAVQAQDFAMAKWALGLRASAATDAAVEEAFTRGEFLRTHVLRPTWHFVSPADLRWMLALTGPRLIERLALRYRELELDPQTLSLGLSVFSRALEGGKQATREELEQALRAARIDPGGQRLPHLLMYGELRGLLTSGARQGKQHTYTLLEERVPPAPPLPREQALAELARRYFTGHGPASLQDYLWWSGLTSADARAGMAANGASLTSHKQNGRTLWFATHSTPAETFSGAILLPVYDEMVVAYTNRDALLTRLGGQPTGPRGNGLMQNLLLLDGQVVGTWRRVERKTRIDLTLERFVPLSPGEEESFTAAAQRFGAFYNLPVTMTSPPKGL